MESPKTVDFLIDHLDPLGQGVSKIGDKITFVPKTLPGEKGSAPVIKESKGVRFCGPPLTITEASPLRTAPDCVHYNDCNGCQFLHTTYEEELKFKASALERHFLQSGLALPEEGIILHKAPARFGYRNRIQLHYKKGQLGLKTPQGLLPIPDCKLPNPTVKEALKELYDKKAARGQGHVELYERSGKVEQTYNRQYAHGGFTQVNPTMNACLQELVAKELRPEKTGHLLDIFGGDGNLTRDYEGPATVIDKYTSKTGNYRGAREFLRLDLYEESSLEAVKKLHHTISTLVIDPPRSGFKGLSQWIQTFAVERIMYVSCWPATMVRDLKAAELIIESIHLVDMFPSTSHFESFVVAHR